MVVVILGMHKSGTTLVSNILHQSGINMGESFDGDVTYDAGNKYERQSVLALNKSILHAPDDEVRELKPLNVLSISETQQTEMSRIIDDCTKAYDHWGLKDPRTTLIYPLWKNTLPKHKLIAIFRPPEQIWPRFKWQGWRRKYVNPLRAWQFINRWVEHNQRIIESVKNHDDCLVLAYMDFMSGDESLKNLGKFVDRPLTDMRKAGLFRSKVKDDVWLLLAKFIIRLSKGVSVDAMLKELNSLSVDSHRRLNN